MLYAVDSIMGSGKTSAAINLINGSSAEKRFLFVTPFLAETDRIVKACPARKFKQPITDAADAVVSESGDEDFFAEYAARTKLSSVHRMLRRGENVATTHSLFNLFEVSTVNILRDQHYTLIIDEAPKVLDVVTAVTRSDMNAIIGHYADVLPNGRVRWKDPKYTGMMSGMKRLADRGMLYANKDFIFSFMDQEIFKAFDDVYMMTYMFDAQLFRCYCDITGIEYKVIGVAGESVSTFRFTAPGEKNATVNTSRYIPLINLFQCKQDLSFCEKRFALSSSWFIRNSGSEQLKALRSALNSFVRYQNKSHAGDVIWTTFKAQENKLAAKGFINSFVSCNAKALNVYGNRHTVAYMMNRFANPLVVQFLRSKGVRVDQDAFALSEMLQWLFRSAIRNDEPINLFMPSLRMRNLLAEWLNAPEGWVKGGGEQRVTTTNI